MRTLFLGLSLVLLLFPARSDAELVWVDATGRMIAPVIGDPFPFANWRMYMDDAGLLWALDPETAMVFIPMVVPRVFTTPDCTGPAYVAGYQPRVVFTIANLPGAWVRRDDVATQMIHITSYDAGLGCNPTDATAPAIPESGLNAVDCTPPDLGACPPLHLERR